MENRKRHVGPRHRTSRDEGASYPSGHVAPPPTSAHLTQHLFRTASICVAAALSDDHSSSNQSLAAALSPHDWLRSVPLRVSSPQSWRRFVPGAVAEPGRKRAVLTLEQPSSSISLSATNSMYCFMSSQFIPIRFTGRASVRNSWTQTRERPVRPVGPVRYQ